MTVREAIDARLKRHRLRLKQAEGRYHSTAAGMDEKSRQSALLQCRVERGILIELEALRREVALCDEV